MFSQVLIWVLRKHKGGAVWRRGRDSLCNTQRRKPPQVAGVAAALRLVEGTYRDEGHREFGGQFTEGLPNIWKEFGLYPQGLLGDIELYPAPHSLPNHQLIFPLHHLNLIEISLLVSGGHWATWDTQINPFEPLL